MKFTIKLIVPASKYELYDGIEAFDPIKTANHTRFLWLYTDSVSADKADATQQFEWFLKWLV